MRSWSSGEEKFWQLQTCCIIDGGNHTGPQTSLYAWDQAIERQMLMPLLDERVAQYVVDYKNVSFLIRNCYIN